MATEPAARRSWTRPDSGGLIRELSITAMPARTARQPTDCYDLTMTVDQVAPPVRRN